MSDIVRSRARAFASCSFLALGLLISLGGVASAADSPASAETASAAAAVTGEHEVDAVVVTAQGQGAAAQVAPVKSDLNAVEPEAVITRQFIEEIAPRVGDFTTSSMLAVSMFGAPNPNGPGATDGGKIGLRSFSDGQFNITYDGIAWGDTNGPSHHANSFFPSSTIGGIVIDRGPGRPDDTGQANFGGQMNLYSLPFEDHLTARQTATMGSFGTYQAVTTVATGPVDALKGANFVFNAMEYSTKGYLTNSPSAGDNQFIKGMIPLGDHLRITALYTRNYDDYNQSDANNTAPVSQVEAYGLRYYLSGDPRNDNYYGYNRTKKETEFGYVRENADFGDQLKLENTTYTYWYSNKTFSAAAQTDASAGAATLASTNLVNLSQNFVYPAGGSGYPSSAKTYGIPGYLKLNWYRVYGDKAEFTKDLDFGTLSFGGMYEFAKTSRHRFDIDVISLAPDYRQKAALYPGPSGCNGPQLTYAVEIAPGKTYNGICEVPLNVEFLEYSGWHQYQLFANFDWKPTPQLTVSPGAKFVHFQLYVHAPALAVSGSIQPSYTSETYTKGLPFLTVNYKLMRDWSVYAQYAQGFLVPDISSRYVNNPLETKIVPQESTNYQLGTVFSAGKFNFDGDVYYIVFKNKIQSIVDLTTNETYETNSGGATYKGIEAQGTYALTREFSLFANGSLNSAIGKDDPINPGGNGRQLAKAPFWTAAGGVRFEHHELFTNEDAVIASVVDKAIGPQFINAASGINKPTGLIHEFDQADFSSTYRIGRYSLELQVLNLGDTHAITSGKGKALIPGTNDIATTVEQGGGANVLTYQTGRSYQLTGKVVF